MFTTLKKIYQIGSFKVFHKDLFIKFNQIHFIDLLLLLYKKKTTQKKIQRCTEVNYKEKKPNNY